MNKINQFQKLFIWIGGFDYDTADRLTSHEVKNLTLLGSMVLIPALIGFFSFGYATYLITDNKLLSIVGGSVWFTVILLIDRTIMGFGKPGEWNLAFFGRLLLAISISIIVPEPIILKAFDDAIVKQEVQNRMVEIESINDKYDTKIEEVESKLSSRETRLATLQKSYTEEMDGTGGSGVKNKGPIFEQKFSDYQDEYERYLASKGNADQQIDAFNRQREQELNSIEGASATGLLGKIKTLNNIDDAAVQAATWSLRVFFFLVELIPFLLKLSLSSDNMYHRMVDELNEEALSVQLETSDDRRRVNIKTENLKNLKIIHDIEKKELETIINSHKDKALHLMRELENLSISKTEIEKRVFENDDFDKESKDIIADEVDKIFRAYVHSLRNISPKKAHFSRN